MIDITEYQQKLEWCYEWMAHKIDGSLPWVSDRSTNEPLIDITVVPNVSHEDVIRIFEQTGVMFWSARRNDMHPASFEEYCKYLKHLNYDLYTGVR